MAGRHPGAAAADDDADGAVAGAGALRSRSLLESFHHAVEGLVHVLHRHRHMRYHFILGALVLLLSAILPVSRDQLLLLAVAITFVVMAELVNSAIETVVDLVSPEYHPLAGMAKDIGGAVVLVASVSAALVVIGVFMTARGLELRSRPEPHVLHVVLVGAAAVITAVVCAKLWSGHWNLTRGGWVSAHSALAFFCFISIFYLSGNPVVWILGLVLAVLVAQSRVEAGIHSIREVLIGAVVALAFGVGMFLLMPPRTGP